MENKVVVTRIRDGAGGRELRVAVEGHKRELCAHGNVLRLDCTTVDILVVTWYYSFARWYHCGELIKSTWDLSELFLMAAWDSTVTSK